MIGIIPSKAANGGRSPARWCSADECSYLDDQIQSTGVRQFHGPLYRTSADRRKWNERSSPPASRRSAAASRCLQAQTPIDGKCSRKNSALPDHGKIGACLLAGVFRHNFVQLAVVRHPLQAQATGKDFRDVVRRLPIARILRDQAARMAGNARGRALGPAMGR